MDPTACHRRFVAAVLAGETDDAYEAAEDLIEWLAKGGADPHWTVGERARFYRWYKLQTELRDID